MQAHAGCDYISFFSGIEKTYFLKVLFENATLITSGSNDYPGMLENTETVFLAFLRLIGCAYMKKHSAIFQGKTPLTHLQSFKSGASSPLEQHALWLESIRTTISFEDEMIPSVDALKRHWLRSCWILDMWSQAQHNNMTLLPLDGNGWLRVSDEELAIDWDSQDNIQRVRDRVSLLLKGCRCKSGCKTNRCSCRKKEKSCGPGCRCTNCENSIHPQPEENRDISHIMRV